MSYDINDKEGIRVAQNFTSVVVEAGGFENVSFIKKMLEIISFKQGDHN